MSDIGNDKKITDWKLDQLEELKKECTVSKRAFTQALKAVNQSVTKVEAGELAMNALVAQSIQGHMAILESKYAVADYYLQCVVSLDNVTKDDYKKYCAKSEELDIDMSTARGKAALCYSRVPSVQNTPAIQAKSKARNEFKCEPLTSSLTPAQLASWIRSFTSYFNGSHFELDSIQEQQAVLLNNLDQELRDKLEPRFATAPGAATIPIFGDTGSCMAIIRSHWEQKYPLIARRLELFRTEQKPGELFTDFLLRLTKAEACADTATLNAETIYILLALRGCNDQKMLEKLLDMTPTPTNRTAIETKAYEVERQRQNTKSIIPSELNAVKSDYRKKKEADRSPSAKPAKPAKQHARPLPAELVGMCLGCASTDHATSGCKDRDKMYCQGCKVRRHTDKCCMKQAWAREDAAKKPGPANSTTNVNAIQTSSTGVSTLTVLDSNPALFTGEI